MTSHHNARRLDDANWQSELEKSHTDTLNAHMNTGKNGLTIQTYAISVLQQSNIDLSNDQNLKRYQDELNSNINTAKDHGTQINTKTLPDCIGFLESMESFFTLHQGIGQSLDSNMSLDDIMTLVGSLVDFENNDGTPFTTISQNLAGNFGSLGTSISNDAANFTGALNDFKSAVSGDKGELPDLEQQLDGIQSKIHSLILAEAASGIALIGGTTLIGIGAATEVFGGLGNLAIAGGVGLVATGIGGTVGGSIGLSKLMQQKSALLAQIHNIQAELTMAENFEKAYSSIVTNANAAGVAAQDMANSFTQMMGAINGMQNWAKTAQTVIDRQTAVNKIVDVYMKTLNKLMQKILEQLSMIKGQLDGVNTQSSFIRIMPPRLYSHASTRWSRKDSGGVELKIDPAQPIWNLLPAGI